MSFVWLADTPLKSREQIAREVHAVSLRRNLDELATVIALMTISTEAGTDDKFGNRQWWCPFNQEDPQSQQFPHDSQSDDGLSTGYFQQQVSAPGAGGQPWGWGGLYGDINGNRRRMTLADAADMFLAALSDNYITAANDPAKAGEFAQQVQKSGYGSRYQDKWDEAWQVLRRALAQPCVPAQPAAPAQPSVPAQPQAPAGPCSQAQPPAPAQPPVPTQPQAPAQPPVPAQPQAPAPAPNTPQFTENNVIGVRPISDNSEPRCGTRIDLFLLHTSEGAGGENLISYMENAQVSYHYIVDNDLDGNTVYDLVDTDLASWSALSANHRSINLVFGRSTVNWSRDEWITNARNAIRIAAYLAVQDCRKYGIPFKVNAPPYDLCSGISDHHYCTVKLPETGNTHTDVGPNFPWDLFAGDVESFAKTQVVPAPMPAPTPAPAAKPVPVPAPTPVPATGPLTDAEQRELLAAARKILGTWSSRSIYRQDDHAVDDTVGMLLNIDATTYDLLIEVQAVMGDPVSLAKVQLLANQEAPGAKNLDGTPNQWAIDRAKGVLARAASLSRIFESVSPPATNGEPAPSPRSPRARKPSAPKTKPAP